MQPSPGDHRSPKARYGTDRYENGLGLIASFGMQFEALYDSDNLRILGSLGSELFTNADVQSLLGSHRQTSWVKLSRLTRAGLVEKRGHSYWIPRYAKELVVALSTTLANLVAIRELSDDSEASKLFRVASEGIDMLYSKGRLEQGEYERTKELLERLTAKYGIPV
ncbi:MAG TPA: hypothetical protein VGS11_13655 [Candidatus Bathyarchaeia archaeon]|nr:hypothetical protein [Candidatus Bathyarchaeia archaeon]